MNGSGNKYYITNNFYSGITAFMGFLLALTGFIFFLVSKEKLQQGFGSIVFPIFASVVSGVSLIFGDYDIYDGYSAFWMTGYAVCCAGIAFLFFVLVFAIVMLVLSNNRQGTKRTLSSPESQSTDMYSELKKIKELYDLGVFTQQEFEIEKKKILQKM
ncbi:MAG: SHOCT domain-containing protein [Clostridia bacterium]|nr:SHOCT domain-containing protein [Clostridia bacterium]